MRRPSVVRRLGTLSRRVQLLLVLAVIATAAGAAAASGATFVSASSTSMNASTTALNGDKMSINGGNGQSAVAGTAVTTDPSVRIVDAGGNPVSGLTVTFAVATGGGAITGNTDITDADGVAEVGSWTLGSTPGANTLTATCAGIASPQQLTFTATGTSGPAVRIALNAGNNQSAVAGATVPIAPSVKVTDAGGNGVPGATVTFAVTSGAGSLVGAATVTTNASGVATIGGWRLGPTVGANTMTATSGTLIGSPVLFTATGTVGPAAKMTINDGNGQTVHAGTSVNIRPSVKITDANNNVVSGVAVTFTPAVGSGSVTGSPATTDASGIATVGSWTLGTVVGPDSLTATSGSLTAVTFTATGIVGSPTTISLTSGNNQSATAGSAVGPLVVRVTDALGYGVQGVAVTFAAAPGSGTVTGGSVLTDLNGYASPTSWTLGTTAGINTATATSPGLTNSPITFSATGTPGAATKYVVNSSSYSPAAGSPVTITAQLADQYNNAVATSGLSVTFTKTGTGGALGTPNPATTGPTGAATITFTTGTTQGTAYTITATSTTPSTRTGTSPTITTAAAVPTRMALNAGNGQSGTVNTAVTTAPSVIVYDAYNNSVPNVVVTFAVASGGGSITGASATTNASGIATVGSWTLGTTAGANTLTASVTGLTGSPVTFTATGTAGPATKYIVTPSTYSPAARSTITLTAQLADQYNNPVATSGIAVTWSRTGTGGQFGSTNTTTNASGIATTTYRVSRYAGRAYTFTARSTTGGTRTGTSATVTVVAGTPTQMALYAGNNQTATVGTAVATAPSVRLRDQYGNNCANAVVTFAVTAGGGNITIASATTDATGVATCGAWTLGTKVGANTLTATRTGVTGSPVTFTATGTVGAASIISLNAGNAQTATVGTAVATVPAVLVTDAYSNPVSGIVVTFAVASGGGTITTASATTSATGVATCGSWTLGTTAGANTLTATRAGLTGSPVTFTATGVAGGATKYVVTSSSYNPVAGTAVTITAQLADQYNNAVATAGISVTFTKTGTGGALGTPNPATTNASGVATITFTTATTVGTAYTVTATSTVPSARTGTSPTITTR